MSPINVDEVRRDAALQSAQWPGTSRATKTRAQLWLEENQAAIDLYNEYVEREDLPLPIYRDL